MPEIEIKHITKYIYDAPVRDSANQIILYPINDDYQEVLKQEVAITGHPGVDKPVDYYGNTVGSFTYIEPHTVMMISSKILGNTRPKILPVNDIFPGQQWEDLTRLRNIVPYIDFLKQEYFEGIEDLRAIVKNERAKDD